MTTSAPIACPVPSPAGQPCTRTIPAGWTVEEGHPGGHFWADAETVDLLRNGHYDVIAAWSGQPFDTHDPADCFPRCPRFGEQGGTTR